MYLKAPDATLVTSVSSPLCWRVPAFCQKAGVSVNADGLVRLIRKTHEKRRPMDALCLANDLASVQPM